MIDAHIHLDQYANVEENIKIWQEAGISGVVAVSIDLQSSYRTLELKQRYPSFVYAAIGFHPELPLPCTADREEWVRLIQLERKHLSAIGEVGLPYYSEAAVSRISEYCDLFEQTVSIAASTSLPLAIHAVYERAEIAFEILKKYKIKKAHFHWLKAEKTIVRKLVQHGYYVSVTPEVCYRDRDKLFLLNVPIENVLIETDGPWPFAGPFTGVETSPLLLKHSINAVASIYNRDVNPAKTIIMENTLRLYG